MVFRADTDIIIIIVINYITISKTDIHLQLK